MSSPSTLLHAPGGETFGIAVGEAPCEAWMLVVSGRVGVEPPEELLALLETQFPTRFHVIKAVEKVAVEIGAKLDLWNH